MVVAGAKTIAANDIANTGGVTNLNATESISGQNLAISGTGARVTLNTAKSVFSGAVSVAGDMAQGAMDGMLNNLAAGFSAGALDITNGGNLNFASGAAEYDIAGDVSVDGAVNVADGVAAVVNAKGVIGAGAVTNNAQLTLDAQGGMNLGNVVNHNPLLRKQRRADYLQRLILCSLRSNFARQTTTTFNLKNCHSVRIFTKDKNFWIICQKNIWGY